MQMKKMSVKTIIKRTISVIFGLGITVLFLYVFSDLLDPTFNYRRIFYIILVCIMYLSGILFLILWNKTKSKLVYLLFFVPVICIAIPVGINEYEKNIQRIPNVRENLNLEDYEPFFWERNRLARLNEEAELKIVDNLPILDGATAFYPVYAAFVQEVYPRIRYNRFGHLVLCSTTANAYKNLLNGKADIIFCLEPSQEQLQQFYDNNMNIKLVPIGKEAFVFFVNIENQLNNLTVENIQGIYSGRIRNWRNLNGLNKKILAYQRPKNSGSQTILGKIMEGIPIAEPLMEEMRTMSDIIDVVAAYRNFNNAIGYSFLIYSTEMVKNNQIKILSINGIYPSTETIQNNSYPFTVNFYAIYNDTENKNENIEPFIEWILSEQGQTLVSRTGYVPIAEYIK